MPPVKDEKPSATPLNTSAQIQRIFSEVQLQLPSVNFDNDDDDDDLTDATHEEILGSHLPEHTDALLESLSSNHTNTFLNVHPRVETPQQPPSVESQMRLSPNLLDNSRQNQNSPPRTSFLSMDLFNSIDFDKLPSSAGSQDNSTLTRTFHRPRPMPSHPPPSRLQPNGKARDDGQILERLAQQANKFNLPERSRPTRDEEAFEAIESALYAASHPNLDRHGRRIGIPQSERKTIYIDLRNSNVPQQEKAQHEPPSANPIRPSSQQNQSSDSESDEDNDRNDGMLWFEQRRQARMQQPK